MLRPAGAKCNCHLSACRGQDYDSSCLQLSDSGLHPHQLDRVHTALAAAPWITRIGLSGRGRLRGLLRG